MLSVQSCMDNYKAKYLNEKTLVDDGGTTLIKNAYEGGLTEIKASQLAATNSQNPAVKDFAQVMITGHSKINHTLDSLEQDKMITEKDTINAEHQELIDSLAKKTGPEFDKAYIALMIAGHTEAEELFADQVDDKNQTIQDFARATLPAVKEHLEKAKEIAAGLK